MLFGGHDHDLTSLSSALLNSIEAMRRSDMGLSRTTARLMIAVRS